MADISRRSIAKGAAWSVPVVSVTLGAPALAASIHQITCPPVSAVLTDTGVKSAQMTSGTQKSYDQTSGHSDLGMGTFFSLNLGMWQFVKPDAEVTGYKLGFGSTVGITTASGVASQGTITAGGVRTPQVIGAGLAMNLSVQSGVPYKLVAKKAENYPAGFTVPFTITYLAGLSNDQTVSPACQYYLNYDTSKSPDGFGNYPDNAGVNNGGAAYTVTTTPTYGV